MDTDAQQLVYISMTSLPVFKDQVTLVPAPPLRGWGGGVMDALLAPLCRQTRRHGLGIQNGRLPVGPSSSTALIRFNNLTLFTRNKKNSSVSDYLCWGGLMGGACRRPVIGIR